MTIGVLQMFSNLLLILSQISTPPDAYARTVLIRRERASLRCSMQDSKWRGGAAKRVEEASGLQDMEVRKVEQIIERTNMQYSLAEVSLQARR